MYLLFTVYAEKGAGCQPMMIDSPKAERVGFYSSIDNLTVVITEIVLT